ncbi:MAG: hypothetical protein WD294_14375 [Phycisphaeraceae bacterium]
MNRLGSANAPQGVVLLDVIIALGLFVLTASVVVGGMSASVNSAFRMGRELTAENLAVSVISEMSAGIRPVTAEGPEPFEAPYEDWTWQVTIPPMPSGQATGGLRNVEVVIIHEADDVTYRLNQFLVIDPAASGEGNVLERLEEL